MYKWFEVAAILTFLALLLNGIPPVAALGYLMTWTVGGMFAVTPIVIVVFVLTLAAKGRLA